MASGNYLGLGVHFSAEGARVSAADGGRVRQIGLIEPDGDYLTWLKLPSGGACCASALERIGVRGEHANAGRSLQRMFEKAMEMLGSGDPKRTHAVIAVPRALSEPQRLALLGVAGGFFHQASLIDSTTAALHATLDAAYDGSGTIVAVIAEEPMLEMSALVPTENSYTVVGYKSLPRWSVNAFHHYLFQLVMDRLPAFGQKALAAADDETISAVFRRIVRAGSVLPRHASVTLSLRELANPAPAVLLTSADIASWCETRNSQVAEAIGGLAKECNRGVDRVVLVGKYGEWPSFLEPLTAAFGQPIVYGIESVADGAALAAATTQAPIVDRTAPVVLVSLEQFAASHSESVVFDRGSALPATSPEQDVDELFGSIARLVAERDYERVRGLLTAVKRRADGVLAALGVATPDASARIPLVAPPAASPLGGAGIEDDLPPRVRRGFEQADALLRSGRILEAVSTSHVMHEQAPASREALMCMLDVHRRGAKLLAEAGDFEAAVQQLKCALRHRQGDDLTRRALGETLLAQAVYVEDAAKDPAAARSLYEEALEYVDDEAVPEIADRLEKLQRLIEAR